jgi:hypothetical protein
MRGHDGDPSPGGKRASARQESNLRPRLRRPVSYPLDHERRSAIARRRGPVGLSGGQSQRVCRCRHTTKSGRSLERPPRRRRSRCNTSTMVTAARHVVKVIAVGWGVGASVMNVSKVRVVIVSGLWSSSSHPLLAVKVRCVTPLGVEVASTSKFSSSAGRPSHTRTPRPRTIGT